MKHDCFRHPVTILAGLGSPAKVHGVKEAYGWLNEAAIEAKFNARNRTQCLQGSTCGRD